MGVEGQKYMPQFCGWNVLIPYSRSALFSRRMFSGFVRIGSAMYIRGAPDSGADNDDLHNLSAVPAWFEVVEMNPIYNASNVPQGAAPSIGSFTAAPATVPRVQARRWPGR